MNQKKIVRRGYDKVSYAYRGEKSAGDFTDYANWLSELIPLLSENAPVLDLGCGCGVPVGQMLAEKFAVTGIDISPVQIARRGVSCRLHNSSVQICRRLIFLPKVSLPSSLSMRSFTYRLRAANPVRPDATLATAARLLFRNSREQKLDGNRRELAWRRRRNDGLESCGRSHLSNMAC
jgi:hypothetical protein